MSSCTWIFLYKEYALNIYVTKVKKTRLNGQLPKGVEKSVLTALWGFLHFSEWR